MTLTFRVRNFLRGHLRHYLSWAALLAFPFIVHQYPEWDGILVIAAGAALRAYASGFLDKEGRLAVRGPFAFVRNPLYLGTILMACGVAISQDAWPALAVIAVVAGGLMHLIARSEEIVLGEKFPRSFPIYLQEVPRFIPRFLPSRKVRDLVATGEVRNESFSRALYRKNRGYEAWITGVALIGLLCAVRAVQIRFG